MSIYATATRESLSLIAEETLGFDVKTERAYHRLCAALRLSGSLLDDDGYLADICKCTKAFWVKRAKPFLMRVFLFDDGQVSHPDIERAPRPGARVIPSHLSLVRKEAQANSVAARRSKAGAAPETDPAEFAKDLQNHLQTVAKDPTKTTDPTDDLQTFANGLAPSLSPLPFPFPTEEETVREGESPRADATAGTFAKLAAEICKPICKPVANAPPAKAPLPPDWRPSEATLAQAAALDVPVEQQLRTFILKMQDDAAVSADFDARFLIWCERYLEWAKRNPQMVAPIVIPGGAAKAADPARKADEDAAEAAACNGTGHGAAFARAVRSLRRDVGEVPYRTWLAKLTFGAIDGNEAVIYAGSKFIADYVQTNYGEQLFLAFKPEVSGIKRLVFEAAAHAVQRQA